MSQSQSSSRLLYLLPIFLGFIGGIIHYVIAKNDDPEQARRGLIVGVLITILPLLAFLLPLMYLGA
jgi:uncharacterized membrane protein (GlpM family)